MKNLLLILVSILMFSCATFHDDPTKSVWADGLWAAFWLPFLGSLPCFYVAYRSSKSNSYREEERGLGKPQIIHDNAGNYKITQLAWFWVGVALQLAAWGICIAVNASA
jgi:hypothetical protein